MADIDLGPEEVSTLLERTLFEAKRVLVGQDRMLERMMVCLLARGHCLLEGVPGLAKTLAVETLARAVRGSFVRIQFTPDLVPSDIVGSTIFKSQRETFDVVLGPVFANFVLADEINRAPAKVQSALLEVMSQQQATINGITYPAPEPFFVLATQNPIESEGVYPLPEAQRDRFLLKILVPYPTPDRGARDHQSHGSGPAAFGAGDRHRRAARAPEGRRLGVRAPAHRGVRGATRVRDARSRGVRGRRRAGDDRLRGEPAREPRSRRGSTCARVAPRSRRRAAAGRHRSRAGRAAPPARADVRRGGRRRDRRDRARPAARGDPATRHHARAEPFPVDSVPVRRSRPAGGVRTRRTTHDARLPRGEPPAPAAGARRGAPTRRPAPGRLPRAWSPAPAPSPRRAASTTWATTSGGWTGASPRARCSPTCATPSPTGSSSCGSSSTTRPACASAPRGT